jgi:hypothetical protein
MTSVPTPVIPSAQTQVIPSSVQKRVSIIYQKYQQPTQISQSIPQNMQVHYQSSQSSANIQQIQQIPNAFVQSNVIQSGRQIPGQILTGSRSSFSINYQAPQQIISQSAAHMNAPSQRVVVNSQQSFPFPPQQINRNPLRY